MCLLHSVTPLFLLLLIIVQIFLFTKILLTVMILWGEMQVGDEPQFLEEGQFQHNCTVRVKRVEILSSQLSGLMTEAEFTSFLRRLCSMEDNPFDFRTVP